jgi:hypothetical protein
MIGTCPVLAEHGNFGPRDHRRFTRHGRIGASAVAATCSTSMKLQPQGPGLAIKELCVMRMVPVDTARRNAGDWRLNTGTAAMLRMDPSWLAIEGAKSLQKLQKLLSLSPLSVVNSRYPSAYGVLIDRLVSGLKSTRWTLQNLPSRTYCMGDRAP